MGVSQQARGERQRGLQGLDLRPKGLHLEGSRTRPEELVAIPRRRKISSGTVYGRPILVKLSIRDDLFSVQLRKALKILTGLLETGTSRRHPGRRLGDFLRSAPCLKIRQMGPGPAPQGSIPGKLGLQIRTVHHAHHIPRPQHIALAHRKLSEQTRHLGGHFHGADFHGARSGQRRILPVFFPDPLLPGPLPEFAHQGPWGCRQSQSAQQDQAEDYFSFIHHVPPPLPEPRSPKSVP